METKGARIEKSAIHCLSGIWDEMWSGTPLPLLPHSCLLSTPTPTPAPQASTSSSCLVSSQADRELLERDLQGRRR